MNPCFKTVLIVNLAARWSDHALNDLINALEDDL